MIRQNRQEKYRDARPQLQAGHRRFARESDCRTDEMLIGKGYQVSIYDREVSLVACTVRTSTTSSRRSRTSRAL